MLDIDLILNELAGARPVFHSEADFQHALAWKIHEHLPDAEIRLEVPMVMRSKESERRLRVDILVDSTCAIELKYKTKYARHPVDEELFVLRSHSAQDFGRYDFLKDIERLEGVVLEGPCIVGYAIMLTNDDSYWRHTKGNQAQDAHFQISDRRRIVGDTLQWGDPGREYRGKRNDGITLKRDYTLSWRNYANRGFKYLVVEVSRERCCSS